MATGSSRITTDPRPVPRAPAEAWLRAAWLAVLGLLCFPILWNSLTRDVAIASWPLEVSGFPAFRDFCNLWMGGLAALSGSYERLFVKTLHGAEIERLLGIRGAELVWSYPPTAFWLALPLAPLPYGLAAGLWTAAGVMAYGAAAGLHRAGLRALPLALGLALAPGLFLCVSYGQTALLTSAILAAGLCGARERPIRSGLLLALLVAKPHLALVVPAALAGLGAWRAFVATGIAAAAYLLLTLAAFGLEPWRLFFDITLPQQLGYLTAERFDFVMLISPFFLLRGFGMPPDWAYAVQLLVALTIMGLLIAALARERDENIRFLLVASGALLASPYLQTYELPLLVLAIVRIVASDQSAARLGEAVVRLLAAFATVVPFLILGVLTKSGHNLVALIPLLLFAVFAGRALRPRRERLSHAPAA